MAIVFPTADEVRAYSQAHGVSVAVAVRLLKRERILEHLNYCVEKRRSMRKQEHLVVLQFLVENIQ